MREESEQYRPMDGLVEIVRGEEQLAENRSPEDKKAYLIKLGRKPIWLDTVEFRIFVYLAEKPYKAYSREQLARAVHRDDDPVTPDSIDGWIESLRRQLGFFADYVQTVPYVGFRFKA